MNNEAPAGLLIKKNLHVLRVIPTQQRAVATLNKLVVVAREILSTTGRETFSLVDVSERAGFAVGTAYRYFTNEVAMLNYVWPKRRDIILQPKKAKKKKESKGE